MRVEDGHSMKKRCACCGAEKEIIFFYKNKGARDGRMYSCKDCTNKRNAKRYEKNKEKINALKRARYWANKEPFTKARKKYEQMHKKQISARKKRYRIEHKNEVMARQREWVNKKRHQDEVFRIGMNLRNYTRRVFVRRGEVDSPRLEAIYGCSCKDLYVYLVKSWEKNYNIPWNGEPCNIDHICPLCAAHTIKEVLSSFHYSNLQLLTPEDNRKKGVKNNSILVKSKV